MLPWDDIYRENSEMLYPLLVVIGGDGTLHQVVSSLQESEKNIPLGYIPAGSGNDFARGMRFYLRNQSKYLENRWDRYSSIGYDHQVS